MSKSKEITPNNLIDRQGELVNLFKNLGADLDTPVDIIKEKLEADFNQQLKIGFFGSPGAGKSTLMNKIIGKNITDAGVSPGVSVTTYK